MAEFLEYDPSDRDKDLIDRVVTRYNISAGYWEPLFEWWRDLLRDYEMEWELVRDDHGDVLYPYRSKIFTPLSFEKIETIVPQIVSVIFDKDPPFAATQGHPGQNPKEVKKTETLLAYQLRNRHFKEDMVHAIQQTVQIGTQILRLRWRYESQYITERRTLWDATGTVPVGVQRRRVEKTSYDGPDFTRVPFYRFFIDPNTPPCALQKAQYLIEEDIKSWTDFKVDADYFGYENVEYLKQLIDRDKSRMGQSQSKLRGRVMKGEYDLRDLPEDDYANDVRLLYYYDREDVITVALPTGSLQSGILMKRWSFDEKCPSGDYPYFSLHIRVNTDRGSETGRDAEANYHPSGFYPPGDLQPLHGIQAAHNVSLNQRIDTVTAGLNPPLIVMGEGLEDEEKLEHGWEPNRILHYRSLSGQPLSNLIYQVPIRDSFGQGWANQMGLLMEMADRSLGVHDVITGQSNPQNITATGVMQETANAMKRFMLKTFILTKMGFEQLLTAMSDMNADLIDPQTVAYVTGDPTPIVINPEEVVRGCNFVIRTAPFYSKQLASDAMLKLLPIAMKAYPHTLMKRALEIIFENQEYIEDVSEVIPKDAPEMTALEVQAAFMGLQMEAQLQQQEKQMKQQLALGGPPGGGQGGGQNLQPPSMPGVAGTGGASGNIPEMDAAADINAQTSVLNS